MSGEFTSYRNRGPGKCGAWQGIATIFVPCANAPGKHGVTCDEHKLHANFRERVRETAPHDPIGEMEADLAVGHGVL